MEGTPLHGPAFVLPDDSNQIPQNVYFVPPKAKKIWKESWLLLWQTEGTGVSMIDQAKYEKPLTQTEYRVRDYIMGTIGIGNMCFINQSEVARQLKIQRADVSRAIKRLISLGIVIAGPKSGRSLTYMINPGFCFAGSLATGIKELKKAKTEHQAKIINFKSICS